MPAHRHRDAMRALVGLWKNTARLIDIKKEVFLIYMK